MTWVLVALIVFLACSRSCLDSDSSFTAIYTIERVSLFKALGLNYSISKTIILKPEDKSFNNIVELELPSIVRFISSVLIIESIEDITSQKVILLK
jgi:hypothetical protein